MTARACLHCRRPYEAKRADRLYCTGACRTAYGRQKKARAQAERDARLRLLAEETLRLLGDGSAAKAEEAVQGAREGLGGQWF